MRCPVSSTTAPSTTPGRKWDSEINPSARPIYNTLKGDRIFFASLTTAELKKVAQGRLAVPMCVARTEPSRFTKLKLVTKTFAIVLLFLRKLSDRLVRAILLYELVRGITKDFNSLL